MKTVHLTLRLGRTTKYGGTYQIGYGARLLTAIGWRLMHQTDAYSYLAPPAGQPGNKLVPVTIEVPDDAEIEALSAAWHAAGVPIRREVFGWPARYTPRREVERERIVLLPFAPADGGPREQRTRESVTYPAQFEIGEFLVWRVSFTWDAGDAAAPWGWQHLGARTTG